jgi:hypothetical protein
MSIDQKELSIEMTKELSDKLIKETLKFFLDKISFKSEQDISYLLNVILGANLTCIFNLMPLIAEDSEITKKNTKEFLEKMKLFLQANVPGYFEFQKK